MAKVNFTAGRVSEFKCAENKSQDFLWCADVAGLAVRATPSSKANRYIFQTKVKSKTMRVTIGKVSVWSIDEAKAEARSLQVEVDNGNDPRQLAIDKALAEVARLQLREKEHTAKLIQDKQETLTLGMVWPLYVKARRKRWSEWSIRDHENIVHAGGVTKVRGKGLTEAAPLASLLNVKLSDLTGIRIAEWLSKEAETRPTRAALAFRLLSVFINWCDSQSEYASLVPSGACKSQQVRDEMPSKNAKEGDSLQREQLASWFKSVSTMNNLVQSAYLQSLLLTGARRRELAALRWADVDFQWLSMTIRDKVEGERTIPLTPYVAHLLSTLPRSNEWVFSSPTSANGQLAEPTPAHKKALLNAGLPDLTLHGLRRSFGSLAEWTETPAGVVAQIMGHKPSAIAEKHYRRRPLDLLRMWHIKIEAWILEQAEVKFEPKQAGLHVIKTA